MSIQSPVERFDHLEDASPSHGTVTVEDVREFAGLYLAHLRADAARREPDSPMQRRRDAQTIAIAEVLHFIDGTLSTGDDLRSRGLIPLTLDDLPTRLGGPPASY